MPDKTCARGHRYNPSNYRPPSETCPVCELLKVKNEKGRHSYLGDASIQDLRDLYGFVRVGLIGPSMKHPWHPGFKDCASIEEARTFVLPMHDQFFGELVWC
jgi:hypothetical protein